MEWIFFAVGVVVVGIVGIALGLLVGRAWASRAERRDGGGEDAFMTPVGVPDEEPADPRDVAGDEAPPEDRAAGADERAGGSGGTLASDAGGSGGTVASDGGAGASDGGDGASDGGGDD